MSTNKQNGHRRPIDWIAEYIQGVDITYTSELSESTASSAERSGAERSVQIIRHTAAEDERVGAWVDRDTIPEWISEDDLPVLTTDLWDYYLDDIEPPEGA